jgi:2-keto-4-pentenoate hydratase
VIDSSVFVRDLADAVAAGRTYPRFPEGLDLRDGEAIQAELVERVASGVAAGLKAGVGESAAQQFLGLEGPMLGFLYEGRRLNDGVELVADPAVRLECELGLRVSARGEVEAVCPVIEFVRPDFALPSDLTGANLAACNIAADRFLPGPWQPWTGSLAGPITVTRSDEIILEAEITGSLGGPEAAVAWMRSEAARRDIALWDGMLFITGTCGQALPLQPGSYEVDFAGLGMLRFGAR